MPRDKALVAFGREVRRRRNALGLTLPEFAERAGLSGNFVGGVENGRRNPSFRTLRRIAAGLEVPLAELLGLPEISGEAIEAGRLVGALPVEVREPIVGALRALAAWAGRKP